MEGLRKSKLVNVVSVRESDNYSMFKIDSMCNRDIDYNWVSKLAKNIDKIGQIEPIKVDSNGVVKNGQHRFCACKMLGLPVKYEIILDEHKDFIKTVNTQQKPWSTKVKLEVAAKTNENYSLFKNLIDEYNLNVSTVLCIYNCGDQSSEVHDEFNKGNFVFDYIKYEKSLKYFELIKRLRLINNSVFRKKNVILAIISLNKFQGLDLNILESQLEKNRGMIFNPSDVRSILSLINEVYNYRRSNKNRTYFIEPSKFKK